MPDKVYRFCAKCGVAPDNPHGCFIVSCVKCQYSWEVDTGKKVDMAAYIKEMQDKMVCPSPPDRLAALREKYGCGRFMALLSLKGPRGYNSDKIRAALDGMQGDIEELLRAIDEASKTQELSDIVIRRQREFLEAKDGDLQRVREEATKWRHEMLDACDMVEKHEAEIARLKEKLRGSDHGQ